MIIIMMIIIIIIIIIIIKLRNNTAQEDESMNAQLIKSGGKVPCDKIHKLIVELWKEKTKPNEWNTATLFPTHKKREKLVCRNYRGISPFIVRYEVYTNTMRISRHVYKRTNN